MIKLANAIPFIILIGIIILGIILILTKDLRINLKSKRLKKQLEKEKGDKYE